MPAITPFRAALLTLATALAASGPARATLVRGVLAGVISSGAETGARIRLAISFDDNPAGGGFTIGSAANAAVLTIGGAVLLSVPAYVMDGTLVPRTVGYCVDPISGRLDLALTYNFRMRAPRSAEMQSRLTLVGSAPVPLVSASGGIDPRFFQAFVGSGTASTFASGLSAGSPAGFYQTSSAFGFALGVPEPSSGALLACGLVLTMGYAAGRDFRRVARPGS
jgi:hypothetical protein